MDKITIFKYGEVPMLSDDEDLPDFIDLKKCWHAKLKYSGYDCLGIGPTYKNLILGKAKQLRFDYFGHNDVPIEWEDN